MHPITIIGTGLAGYQLAREFRQQDRETPLRLITQDDGYYYSKPLLSTALTLKKTADTLKMSTREKMASDLNAEVISNTLVTAIHPETRTITTANGDEYTYAKLVLACGAERIKPNIKGAETIYSVNHLDHYADFLEGLQEKKRIVILGVGLVGCEFANDLANAGFDVHTVAPVTTPLAPLIPEQAGRLLQASLATLGVHWHLGKTVAEIQISDNGYHLILSDGSQLDADVVLSAIGIKPHLDLAKSAHLAVNHGIIVNRYLETSDPHIYALGDCAEVEGHVLPYIAPLLASTKTLAKTLQGEKTAVTYSAMPVIIKTPAHPIAILPPPKNIHGHWTMEESVAGLRGMFRDNNNILRGFVLTGQTLKERFELVKEVPALF